MLKQESFPKKLKCVVLCAGRGQRIRPYSEYIPKVMVEINGQPILKYVIDYCKQFSEEFIFVVGYKKEQVIDYVKKLDIKYEFVKQEEPRGIADAISKTKDVVSDQFLVVLGDCLYSGNFEMPSDIDQAIGVIKVDDVDSIMLNYSVMLHQGAVKKVVEKPTSIINNLCGMGFYLFNRKIFTYIKQTPQSPLRDEIEITDVIQKMIEGGEQITPLFFNGRYLNVTYPKDVQLSEKMLLQST